MANKKFRNRNQRPKTVKCSCGSESKLTSRKNYSHGKNSKSKTSWFYRCKECGKLTHPNNEEGGKR